MKEKYIFTGLLNREHAAFKKSDAEMWIYGLIAGEIYNIEGTHGMRYITPNKLGRQYTLCTIDNHPYINQQLVNIYFKPLREVRDIKIEQLLV